ncbi:MAG TPA: SDR family oxidoreductase [Blastocatellia bacterium]|nr:SDR family oxidoreductase [Blastocatellia bacterium]
MAEGLSGLAALVTGAAGGIGLATARLLYERGASVALVDRDARRGEAALAGFAGAPARAIFVAADLAREEEAGRAVAAAARAFGRLTSVVNSAGIQRYGDAEQTSLPLWHEVLGANLTSAFLVARAALPHLRQAGGGAIVNVGSVQSHGAQRGAVAYVTSKHALLGLTRALAVDCAPDHIRVNCVCPGTVDTPMFRASAALDPDPASLLAACAGMHALGRIARPEEVASAISFLLGDGASFITGSALDVDGGLLALIGGSPRPAAAE